MVIIPDYYRGKICDVTKENLDTIMTFLKTESVWDGKLKEDWEKSVCPYATKNGAISFGTIGKKYNVPQDQDVPIAICHFHLSLHIIFIIYVSFLRVLLGIISGDSIIC